jgi:hypothetical protein
MGVVMALVLLAGCAPVPPAPTPAVPTEAAQTPISTEAPAPVSPLPSPTGAAIDVSPLPSPAAQQQRFEIDRPVKASDTVLRGSGLPGIGLEAHDVTRMGVQLGAGVVGDDGRFEITVGALTPSVRLGITLAEDDQSIWSNPALLGPESLVVPMVGAYLDTVLVEP